MSSQCSQGPLKKTHDAIPEEILAEYKQIHSIEKGGHNRE